MGFGGYGSVNIVLKNNKNLLRKRKHFETSLGGYSKTEKPVYKFPVSTPHKLRSIKERLERENKQRQLKQIIVVSIIYIMLISAFIFYLKSH